MHNLLNISHQAVPTDYYKLFPACATELFIECHQRGWHCKANDRTCGPSPEGRMLVMSLRESTMETQAAAVLPLVWGETDNTIYVS